MRFEGITDREILRVPLVLTLERPLTFLDIEGTGRNASVDRIVELGLITVSPPWVEGVVSRDMATDAGEPALEGEPIHGVQAVERFEHRFNPTVPIAPDATAVHGIADADVAGAPTFAELAAEVWRIVGESDFAGYNLVQYDMPMLAAELERAGFDLDWESRNIIDAQQIFFLRNPRDLSAAVERYTGRELVDAHGAMPDTEATAAVLVGQLLEHDDLPVDAAGLDRYCRRPEWADRQGKIHRRDDGVLVFGFGKHVGAPILERRDYCRWIMKNDFPRDTKRVIEQAFAEAGSAAAAAKQEG